MPKEPVPSLVVQFAGCLLCGIPALWVIWPVLLAQDPAIPGPGFGDNVAALWNVWWFTEAPRTDGWPYWTPLLFAPFGTQLSLHTHATSHSLLAWAWMSAAPVVPAHNLAITTGLFLNGACTFLLAYRMTGRLLPAVAAGLLFSAGASVQVRLLGHINLVHAWVLPLFALALLHFIARPGAGRALLLGAAGAAVVYTDYYYAVYAIVLVAAWLLARAVSLRMRRLPPRPGPLATALLVLLVVDIVVIAVVAATGGTALSLGGLTVSLRGLRNPLTLFWLLLAAWGLRRYPVRVSLGWVAKWPSLRDSAPALIAIAAFAALTSLLWLALLRVVAAGDYTTQTILWRSSPPGGDLLTVLLGHPRHLLTGDWTRAAYAALGIDVMEQSLWVGILPLLLIAVGVRQWQRVPEARLWIVAGFVFAVLALGPFLRVGGADTALPLPHALLRYMPVISNARIPGRAVVMVQLAVAMLCALALAKRSNRSCALVLVLLALEALPAPVQPQVLPRPDAVDEMLRTAPEPGAVAELPMGLRDGFGQSGDLEHRALAHQMAHGRPLAGGFVARLAPGLQRAYAETPILNELVAISTPAETGQALEPQAAARAFDAGIAFLVVNRDTFVDRRLSRGTLEKAGFTFLASSGPRELYATRSRSAVAGLVR